MSCEFAHHDGAYVLGTLSPAERAEYQQHLTECRRCARAVQELAGLPGLLARTTPDVLDAPAVDEPVPETLLPTLIRRLRRRQLRRTWVLTGAAAGIAMIVALGSVAVTRAVDDDSSNAAVGVTVPGQHARAMVAVGSDAMSADLALTSVAWGTRLDLTCKYPADEPRWDETGTSGYAMFVRTRDGHVEEVATWRGLPGKTMRLTGATATSRDDIASVEIRTTDGKPVLRLVS